MPYLWVSNIGLLALLILLDTVLLRRSSVFAANLFPKRFKSHLSTSVSSEAHWALRTLNAFGLGALTVLVCTNLANSDSATSLLEALRAIMLLTASGVYAVYLWLEFSRMRVLNESYATQNGLSELEENAEGEIEGRAVKSKLSSKRDTNSWLEVLAVVCFGLPIALFLIEVITLPQDVRGQFFLHASVWLIPTALLIFTTLHGASMLNHHHRIKSGLTLPQYSPSLMSQDDLFAFLLKACLFFSSIAILASLFGHRELLLADPIDPVIRTKTALAIFIAIILGVILMIRHRYGIRGYRTLSISLISLVCTVFFVAWVANVSLSN